MSIIFCNPVEHKSCTWWKKNATIPNYIRKKKKIIGETIHYELISKAVAAGLVEVIVNSKKPIALGIISAETKDQAIARASSKGKEFAQSLLESLAR